MAYASIGYNIAMEIEQTFRPKYWKAKNYANHQYRMFQVNYYNNQNELMEILTAIANAIYDVSYNDVDIEIFRVQNPFSYARFMLRKMELKKKHGHVYQFRKFKYIDIEDIDMALKYNCDSRRYGYDKANYVFYSDLPHNHDITAVAVLKVLSVDYEAEYDVIQSLNDSEFYIEYIVQFP